MGREKPDSLARLLRRIPSVERLLEREGFRLLEDEFGRTELVAAVRSAISEIREALMKERIGTPDSGEALESLEQSVQRKLRATTSGSLVPLVNATGIIIHTNLGRAPLSEPAVEALSRVARGYSNLEYDLERGGRGDRGQHARQLLARLFPAQDALVVNNNAAAVLLVLNTFAASREVIISRGELVEIGGSFRIPEILARSGARLREVGTTNKTRLRDYEEALGEATGLILRVHLSNFRMIGFTESAATEELVALGRVHGVPVVEDFGSGNLLALGDYGLAREPTVEDSLSKGVDLVTFSGDKLLGGPQAGILVGSAERVAPCRKNPLARALRVGKLTYAALEATLASHLRGKALEEIPVLKMLSTAASAVRSRSERLLAGLGPLDGVEASIEPGFSKVGGGAAPEEEIPTFLIALTAGRLSAQQILDGLRTCRPPVIARIAEDRVLLDLRTVLPGEEPALATALRHVLGKALS